MDLRAPEPSERHDDPRLLRARAALGYARSGVRLTGILLAPAERASPR